MDDMSNNGYIKILEHMAETIEGTIASWPEPHDVKVVMWDHDISAMTIANYLNIAVEGNSQIPVGTYYIMNMHYYRQAINSAFGVMSDG